MDTRDVSPLEAKAKYEIGVHGVGGEFPKPPCPPSPTIRMLSSARNSSGDVAVREVTELERFNESAFAVL